MTERANHNTTWDDVQARVIAESMKTLAGACLPILHELQNTFGYIHEEAIPIVADVLNLSKAEVVGVVNFYSDFRQEPPAAHVVKVCLAESCQSMGSAAVVERLQSALGVSMGESAADHRVELAPVYCLGNCALSPAIVVDGKLSGRVTPDRAAQLVAERVR
ncbi:MAG: NAD(P)H-dependent oxidoreductase subunit E [Dehalococcoidia bacterium]